MRISLQMTLMTLIPIIFISMALGIQDRGHLHHPIHLKMGQTRPTSRLSAGILGPFQQMIMFKPRCMQFISLLQINRFRWLQMIRPRYMLLQMMKSLSSFPSSQRFRRKS